PFYSLFSFPTLSPSAPYTLSLHDALPICSHDSALVVVAIAHRRGRSGSAGTVVPVRAAHDVTSCRAACSAPQENISARSAADWADRKSTRLNSSHVAISYAVFCLKKKKKK